MTASGGKIELVQLLKYIYSTVLLVFCITIIFGLVFTEQTALSHDTHPAVAFVVLIISIGWLTMVEGGQGAIVGLGPVNGDLFKDSHPLAYRCTSLVHKGDNLDRYLLGRQFMVILIVFTVEMSGAVGHGIEAELWGFPSWLTNIFLVSGLAMILFTCMVGQLNSEINGCHCMLDYINTWFAVITVWVALAIEFSGLLHICYLIQQGTAYLAGKPIKSNEPARSALQNIFFYGRCLMSIAVLCFAFAVTLTALFGGNTTMWDSVPPGASIVLFFGLLCIVGLLEASQIAYFAVTKLTKEERKTNWFGDSTCEILFKNNNHNLAAFMVGRQLCVVSCMFVIARITSCSMKEGEENIFGVSDGAQSLFNTGLLGALIVAVVGSISWRLLSAAFPMFFLANPACYILLRWCLLLEYTGILHGAWVLAAIHKKLAGFQRDEVYIGTAEERAAQNLADKTKSFQNGHPIPAVDVGENPIDSFDEIEGKNIDKIGAPDDTGTPEITEVEAQA